MSFKAEEAIVPAEADLPAVAGVSELLEERGKSAGLSEEVDRAESEPGVTL